MLKVLCGKIKQETADGGGSGSGTAVEESYAVASPASSDSGDEDTDESFVVDPTAPGDLGKGVKISKRKKVKVLKAASSGAQVPAADPDSESSSPSAMNIISPLAESSTRPMSPTPAAPAPAPAAGDGDGDGGGDGSTLSALCFIAEVVTSNSKATNITPGTALGGLSLSSGKKPASHAQLSAHFAAAAAAEGTAPTTSSRRRSRASTVGSFFDGNPNPSGNAQKGSPSAIAVSPASANVSATKQSQSLQSAAMGNALDAASAAGFSQGSGDPLPGSSTKPRRRRAGSTASRSGSFDATVAAAASASTAASAAEAALATSRSCGSINTSSSTTTSSPHTGAAGGGECESESEANSVARLLAGLSDSAADFTLSPLRSRSSSVGTRPVHSTSGGSSGSNALQSSLMRIGVAGTPHSTAVTASTSSSTGAASAVSSTSHREFLSRTTVTSAAKFAGSTITFPRLNSDSYAMRRQQLQQQQQQQKGQGSSASTTGGETSTSPTAAGTSATTVKAEPSASSTLPGTGTDNKTSAEPNISPAALAMGVTTSGSKAQPQPPSQLRPRGRSISDHSDGSTSNSTVGSSTGNHSNSDDDDEKDAEMDDISSRYATAACHVGASGDSSDSAVDLNGSGLDSPPVTDVDSVPSPSPVAKLTKHQQQQSSSTKPHRHPRTRTMSMSVPMSLMSVNGGQEDSTENKVKDRGGEMEEEEDGEGSTTATSGNGSDVESCTTNSPRPPPRFYSNTSILQQFNCNNIAESINGQQQNLSGLMLESSAANCAGPASGTADSAPMEDCGGSGSGLDDVTSGAVDDPAEEGAEGGMMDSNEYMTMLLKHAAAAAEADEACGSSCSRGGRKGSGGRGRRGAAGDSGGVGKGGEGEGAGEGEGSFDRDEDGSEGDSDSDGDGGRVGEGGKEDGVHYIGVYSPDERYKRLLRFFSKRSKRVWTKRVKYDVRKNFADSRVRVKGRFVKKEDEEFLMNEHVETMVMGTGLGAEVGDAAAQGAVGAPADAADGETAGADAAAPAAAAPAAVNSSLLAPAGSAAAGTAASPSRHVAAALITLADAL